ncbi:MAG: glycosyltransferase [Bacteroidales bacterium]
MSKKVVILGSAHPLRGGGIATFNERMAKAFIEGGYELEIVSFSLQYPSIFFPGKSQYSDDPAPEGLKIHSWLNSINPFNWFSTARKIRKLNPDLVVVRYWIPFMAPSLGTVSRRLRRGGKTKVVAVVDNAIPHEKRFGDKFLTKYFVKSVDAFVTMSQQVYNDLLSFDNIKPKINTVHPLYDNFGEIASKQEAAEKLKLDVNEKYLLFFGFIRDYKGLDWLLESIADERLKDKNFKLIIAGEYYSGKEETEALIEKLGISHKLIMHTNFISNEMVRYYFSLADIIVQPYKSATQSGVTQVAYHFNKPIITTDVGGLAEIVLDKKTGYIAQPNINSITETIDRYFKTCDEIDFEGNIKEEKLKYSWSNFIETILSL